MKVYLVINCFLFILVLIVGSSFLLFPEYAEPLSIKNSIEKHPYHSLKLASDNLDIGLWDKPVSQSSGEDWVFEVFTPPIIYFDPRTNEWTLEPPTEESEKVMPFGLELLVFQRELYRLQYNGYLVAPSGEEENTTVLIDNLETEKGIYGRVGQRFEDDQFYIRSFDVKRYLVQSDNPKQTPYLDENISLVVFDERLGKEMTLTGNKKKYKPNVKAVIRSKENPIQAVTVGEGESFAIDKVEYECVEINLTHNSVRVKKNFPATVNEMIETLTAQPGIDGTTLLHSISEPKRSSQNKLEQYQSVTSLEES